MRFDFLLNGMSERTNGRWMCACKWNGKCVKCEWKFERQNGGAPPVRNYALAENWYSVIIRAVIIIIIAGESHKFCIASAILIYCGTCRRCVRAYVCVRVVCMISDVFWRCNALHVVSCLRCRRQSSQFILKTSESLRSIHIVFIKAWHVPCEKRGGERERECSDGAQSELEKLYFCVSIHSFPSPITGKNGKNIEKWICRGRHDMEDSSNGHASTKRPKVRFITRWSKKWKNLFPPAMEENRKHPPKSGCIQSENIVFCY